MLLDEMREGLTGEKSYGVQVNKVQHDTGTGSYPGHIHICCTMLEKKIFLSKQKKTKKEALPEVRKRQEKDEKSGKIRQRNTGFVAHGHVDHSSLRTQKFQGMCFLVHSSTLYWTILNVDYTDLFHVRLTA